MDGNTYIKNNIYKRFIYYAKELRYTLNVFFVYFYS